MPNHPPISAPMGGATGACNTTLIIANQHTQPDMVGCLMVQFVGVGCSGLDSGAWLGQAGVEDSC